MDIKNDTFYYFDDIINIKGLNTNLGGGYFYPSVVFPLITQKR